MLEAHFEALPQLILQVYVVLTEVPSLNP